MTLQEKLERAKTDFMQNAPPETIAIMHRARGDRRNSRLIEKALKGGQGPGFFAISPQIEAFNREVVQQHKLLFDILSDPENQVARKFGFSHELPEYLRESNGRKSRIRLG